jgi:lipoprotein-releasing system ATP-binding protein
MNNAIVRAENVHKSYALGRSELPVLRGVNLLANRGEFLAIMGSSGSGKSTLLHVLGALDVPQKGQVYFNGEPVFPPESDRGFPDLDDETAVRTGLQLRAGRLDAATNRLRNKSFGFVFQFYHLLPEYNVLENTLLPQIVGASAGQWSESQPDARARAVELLTTLGLAGRLTHLPSELSGGERQRVAIARALINQPAVLLADEPTGNLDSTTGAGILAVLRRLNDAGQTILMVTHDTEVAKAAHRIVRLSDGRLG